MFVPRCARAARVAKGPKSDAFGAMFKRVPTEQAVVRRGIHQPRRFLRLVEPQRLSRRLTRANIGRDRLLVALEGQQIQADNIEQSDGILILSQVGTLPQRVLEQPQIGRRAFDGPRPRRHQIIFFFAVRLVH